MPSKKKNFILDKKISTDTTLRKSRELMKKMYNAGKRGDNFDVAFLTILL